MIKVERILRGRVKLQEKVNQKGNKKNIKKKKKEEKKVDTAYNIESSKYLDNCIAAFTPKVFRQFKLHIKNVGVKVGGCRNIWYIFTGNKHNYNEN